MNDSDVSVRLSDIVVHVPDVTFQLPLILPCQGHLPEVVLVLTVQVPLRHHQLTRAHFAVLHLVVQLLEGEVGRQVSPKVDHQLVLRIQLLRFVVLAALECLLLVLDSLLIAHNVSLNQVLVLACDQVHVLVDPLRILGVEQLRVDLRELLRQLRQTHRDEGHEVVALEGVTLPHLRVRCS